MAVSNGVYGLTLLGALNETNGESFSASDNVKVMLVTDTYAPDFTTHDFRSDITNEVTIDTGYTAAGMVVTGNTVSVATGTLKFDVTTDPVWTTATIASAEAGIYYLVNGGTAAAEELIACQDFGSAYSSTAGDFTITEPATGVFTIDYTP